MCSTIYIYSIVNPAQVHHISDGNLQAHLLFTSDLLINFYKVFVKRLFVKNGVNVYLPTQADCSVCVVKMFKTRRALREAS